MKKRILSLALVLAMSVGMMACGGKDENLVDPTPTTAASTDNQGDKQPEATATPAPAKKLEYAAGTVLRMATGYNNAKTGICFDAETAGEGVTLADGKTYNAGDLKPTWVELQNVLNVTFENKYQGKKESDEFIYWEPQLDQVDMVSGGASQLSEAGIAGKVVNIAEYLDYMPNFKAYLEANPIVRLSITGDTTTGAIYFSPYFDGVNDIERMPLMRTDWVEKLLNGAGQFTATGSNNVKASVYTPYMPTSGKVEIDVVNEAGTAVEKVTKDYDKAGNIVQKMNDALAKGTLSGVEAVNMLRTYIDEAYNGYYGENRANLFIGQNAAWDADELVALLRCVVANPQTLNGTDAVQGLFSREDDNNQRRVDMYKLAAILFGVRGMESRSDYLYIGTDGLLHDARQEEATYVALEKMNAMAQEGLIASSFMNMEDTDTKTMLANDTGFMHYDYNQTQTVYNETSLQDGEKYMAVLVPVAKWNDGTEKYMRFTESWRSVKTGGWGISKAGVEGNQDKLFAALALIDYAYSPKGTILMSYGPDAFIKTNADGSYVTFNFNGTQMPEIADATYDELWAKASGNYTNYARMYLGSTLSFMKSQAFEYQCTHNVGKEGAGHISTAIGLGVIKHPELALTENPWYTSVPTVLPTTVAENELINSYTELSNKGYFGTGKGESHMFVNVITGGYAGVGAAEVKDAASAASTVANAWNGSAYLAFKEMAWQKLKVYYDSIK